MWGCIPMSIPVLLSIMFISSSKMHTIVHAELADKPFFFIFGDSLADNGNNNKLPTRAKANYYPYGVDFNGTNDNGRFTNGLTLMDVMTKLAGLDQPIASYNSIPIAPQAYTPTTSGINYASGGAGILPESGSNLLLGDIEVMSFGQQVSCHADIIKRFAGKFLSDPEKRKEFLGNSVYVILIGSNDYLLNYFEHSGSFISRQAFTPDEFAMILMDQYSKHLQVLYDLGARKFALFCLSLITGCTPEAILVYGRTFGSFCYVDINNAIQIFNDKLRTLVEDLNQHKINATFVLVDLNGVLLTPFQGFTELTKSCCLVTRSTALCERGIEPCKDRNSHVFFDNIHPTEAANRFFGKSAWEQMRSLLTPVGNYQ